MNNFWSKVIKTDECWNWNAAKTTAGYGQTTSEGRVQYAHRVSYEMSVSKIPKGLVIDHLCKNKSCVNPEHMEVVTHRENTIRGVKKGVCPSGHKLEGENLYTNSHGHRACKTCKRDWARKHYHVKSPRV